MTAVEKISSLVDGKGLLWAQITDVYKNADMTQVELELRSQIEWAKKMGLPIEYLTSHLDVLTYNETYFKIMAKLASEYNVCIRFLNSPSYGNDMEAREMLLKSKKIIHPDYIIWNELDSIKSSRDVAPVLESILKNLKPGVTELFIHPSILSPEIKRLTRSYSRRIEEYEWADNSELQETIKQMGIKIISYSDLYKLQQSMQLTKK